MRIDEKRLTVLLSRLEQAWRANGAPIADHLAPGIASHAIDTLTGPIGIAVPDELKVWWGWHNGTTAEWGSKERNIGPGGWGFPSVREAVDQYHRELAGPQLIAEDIYWRASWLPIIFIDGKSCLYIDASMARPGRTVPVRERSWEWEDLHEDRAASFTDAVQIWVSLLEDGYYFWDPNLEEWNLDRYGEIPVAIRSNGPI